MLWILLFVLIVVWLLVTIVSWTFGGLIHLLLVIAVIILIYNLVTGRRNA